MSIRSLLGISRASYQVSTEPSPLVVFCTNVAVRYHLPSYLVLICWRISRPVGAGARLGWIGSDGTSRHNAKVASGMADSGTGVRGENAGAYGRGPERFRSGGG